MKKNDLKKRLMEENVPEDLYSLNGGLPNESYCIGKSCDSWEVYYSERGKKTSLKTFKSEDEACHFFYIWVTQSLEQWN